MTVPPIHNATSRHVTADGIRLHIVEAGAGPLVILLHGFPEFSYSWRRQLPALAEAGFHAVAPDLRGYNESERPPRMRDYRLRHLVDDVACHIAHSRPGHPCAHDPRG